VVTDQTRPYEKEQLSPDDLGLLPTPQEPRLARLVLLQRGTDEPRGLARVDTTDALLRLVEQSSSLTMLPRPLQTLHALIESCHGVWGLSYDEIGDHVEELLELLAVDPPSPTTSPRLIWHEGEPHFPLEEDPYGPVLARLPWSEAVEVDDDLIVLTGAWAWLFADVTATVWLSLAEPATFEDLLRAAIGRHGEHPEARSVVEQAVATLFDKELIAYGWLA
jgi:hypothetical protein